MRKNIIRGVTGGCGVAVLIMLGAFGMVSDKVGEHSGVAGVMKAAADPVNPFFVSGLDQAWLSGKFELPVTQQAVTEQTVTAVTPEAVSEAAAEVPVEVSAPAAEPEIIQPEPQPNAQILVAAQQPAEETPAPEEQPAEVPVISAVEEPGNVQVDTITVAPPEETPAPADTGNYTSDTQMASIQGGCTIMGTTYTYLDQMIRYYCANQEYPAFYQGTDAPTIQAFCQIYVEEAQAEGVRAEVAFCQAMKETGFLRYQGDVRIEQFNFAGIGATGGGVQGNYFGSVRDGIRAQIQHLKAYASTEALNGACVDPRFHYVKRGTTPYVEWLGIHENPYGGGWAAALNYGGSIINDYIAKLFSY